MTRKHRRTTDERAYAAADSAFTAEGGPVLGPPASPSGSESAMAEFGISFDDRQYEYNGYRYDRLDDAVAYAKLIRSRPTQLDAWGAFVLPSRFAAPSDAQRTLMTALAITFDGRAYHFEGFRYDELADAVSYARLRSTGDAA
jgi:hypothetical protein